MPEESEESLKSDSDGASDSVTSFSDLEDILSQSQKSKVPNVNKRSMFTPKAKAVEDLGSSMVVGGAKVVSKEEQPKKLDDMVSALKNIRRK